jgi:TolA-binding protein
MSQQILSFENHEYDISSLLTVQFNFEQLKFLITSLVKNQKQSNQRITDLEEKILNRDKRIDELEKQSNNQDIFLSSKYKNFFSHKSSTEQIAKDGKVLKYEIKFVYL